MQLTVFSVEPQGGGVQKLADISVTQDVFATDSAEIFAEVFVEPKTLDVDAPASPLRELAALAAPPETTAGPLNLDNATPGMAANVAPDREVGALQSPEEATSLLAPARHKSGRHLTVADRGLQKRNPPEAAAPRNAGAPTETPIAEKAVFKVSSAQAHATDHADAPVRPDTKGAIPEDTSKRTDMSRSPRIQQDRPAVSVPKELNAQPDMPVRPDPPVSVPDGQPFQKSSAPKLTPDSQDQTQDKFLNDAAKDAPKALKPKGEPQTLPGTDDRGSENTVSTLKPTLPQGVKPQGEKSGLSQPHSAQTSKSGKPSLYESQDIAPRQKSPPPSSPEAQTHFISLPAIRLNDTRYNIHPAVNSDTAQSPVPPGATADHKAQHLAPSVPSVNATEQGEYTVEIVSRGADHRAPNVSRQPSQIHLHPAPMASAFPTAAPADKADAYVTPNPAAPHRTGTASLSDGPPTPPGETIKQQVAAQQPMPTAANAPTAAPTPTSQTPSFTVFPNSVIGTRAKEAVDFIDQALTASNSDGLSREDRAPALDIARRSISGASRVELARSVVAQIADAARGSIDGTIEVRLSPEELGRVRMSMRQSELGLTVTIFAERAETLDLIRRNTELFAQDLRNLGHQNIAFSFDQGAERQPFDDDTGGPDITTEESEVETDNSPQHLHTSRFAGDGHLDIRL